MGEPLTLRQLNRAALARQHLLERTPMTVVEAVEALAGLNAQDPYQPYISLWSRLEAFAADDLESALNDRQVVKATLMRSTLHMVGRADFLAWRPALQPVLERAFRSYFRQEYASLDLEELAAQADAVLKEEARTFPQLREDLSDVAPGADPASLSFGARALLPLVQVPPAGLWGFHGSPPYRCGETWLAAAVGDAAAGRRSLVRRYLQAFGPASLSDLTRWAGFSLRDAARELGDELVTLKGQKGEKLVDLAGLDLPDDDTPAPPRLLPSWDNLLLAYRDPSRVLSETFRDRVIKGAGVYEPVVLLDGFVAGTWDWQQADDDRAVLTVSLFDVLDAATEEALHSEAARLLGFLAPKAGDRQVRTEQVV